MKHEATSPSVEHTLTASAMPHEAAAMRAVLGHVPVFVWKYHPASRRFLYASEFIGELSGLSLPEFLEDSAVWFDRVGADQASLLALAEAEIAIRNGKAFDVVYRFQTPHRGWRWFQAAARPAHENGELYYYGCTTDVTERRLAEEEALRLATSLEQADEAFIITGRDGRIAYVNGAFTRMTGYSREEAIGNTPSMLKSGRQDETFYREMWRTIAGGEPWRGRFINRRKDGSHYEQWATITPLRDETGAIAGFVAVQLDMTQQLELERRLARAERLASVGEAISGAAHTIKNVLNTLKGSVYLVDRAMAGETSEKLRQVWEVFQRSTDRLDQLTHSMLDYVRTSQLALEPLDLNALCGEILDSCRTLAATNHITLQLATAPCLPLVPGDKAALHDAILNLLSNAIEACAGRQVGQVRLVTRVVPEERAVEVAVEDNGPGIDPEHLEKLFQPFFTTKGHKGNGLGLAMVQKTVQAHRGSIEVDSSAGRTCFTLRLPL